MKTCSKCNELNGENRTECWKCKTPLGGSEVAKYKKICPKCGLIYSQKSENCEECGSRLSVYSGSDHYKIPTSSDGGCWMYIVSVLFPFIGIILGCIYIARQKDELGKSLIITSVVTIIAVTFLGIMLGSCSVM